MSSQSSLPTSLINTITMIWRQQSVSLNLAVRQLGIQCTSPCLQASATPAGRHPYGLATGALYIECVSVQSRLLLKECLRHFETESCQATGCGDGTNNKCRSMLCRMTRRLPSNIGNTRKEYQQSTQNLLARFLLVHIVFASDSLPTMSDTKLASSSSSSGTGQLSWGARLF